MINLLWFQFGWWTLVLTASQGYDWLGFLVALILLGVHFQWLSANKKRDLIIFVASASLGISGDFLLIRLGVFNLPDPETFFPLWLTGLWLIFPLTLPYSLKPLLERTLLLPGLALAAGFSYYAGTYFGILITAEPIFQNLLIASGAWLVYLGSFRNLLNKL